MRSISMRLAEMEKVKINIGYVGENEHTTVLIDCKKAFDEYPEAVASLTVRPPRGGEYPAVVVRNGNIVEWTVTDSDLIYAGNGEIQLTFTVGEVIVKTAIGTTVINRSLMRPGDIPTPIQNWIEQANQKIAAAEEATREAKAAAEHQPIIDDNGNWNTWDDDEGAYVDTGIKAQGEDGAPGRDGQDGRDGHDGQDGKDGQDGAPGQDGTDATPDLITKDYADLTFPVAKDSFCYHDGKLYQAKQDIQTSEAWTAAHWQETTVEEQLSTVKSDLTAKADLVVDTIRASVVQIPDGIADAPVDGLKIYIIPAQAGSGDPSPTNFRELTGYTGANLNQSGIDVNNPTVTQISWQTEAGTIYYGTLDVLSGVLTVTHKGFKLAFNDMNLSESYPGWQTVPGLRDCYSNYDGYSNITICNLCKPNLMSHDIRVETQNNKSTVYIPKSYLNVANQTEAKSVYADKYLEFVSPLLETATYQLDPVTGVSLLAGENNFWNNAGDTEVTYPCETKGYVDKKEEEKVYPINTSFFDGINYFDPATAKFVQGNYISSGGVITASSTSNSIIFPVKPNTRYWFYIPNVNRAYVGTSMTDVFTVGQTYTLVRGNSVSNAPFDFTTDNVARYVFIYFYSGGVYDYESNKGSATLYIDKQNYYNRPYIPNEYLPDGAINPLTDANILIFGDSITSCCDLTINASNQTTAYSWRDPSNQYTNAGGSTVKYSMWPKILKISQPVKEIRNYAFAGAEYKTTTRTSGEERKNLQYQIDVAMNDLSNPNSVFSVSNFVPDIVIFALGTNDGNPADTYDSVMNATVYDGTEIDTDATLAALDDTKTIGSARKAFMRIKEQFPTAQIYVVLPIQTANSDTNLGTLHTYLEQMANRYGCIIIDGTYDSGITRDFNVPSGLGMYLKDGLHPNEKGQNMMARMILSAIKAHYVPFGYGFNQ